jgi:tetratricopeptide (TPR) repeat protein
MGNMETAIKGICLCLLTAFLSPLLLAQTGRGDLFMSGFVRNENGSPQEGARVVAVLGGRIEGAPTSPMSTSSYSQIFLVDRSPIIRETKTDEDGKWVLQFLKKGNWIVSAFSREKMSPLTDILLSTNRREIELVLTETAAGFLFAAKSAIYEDDYERAIQILAWFIEYFPESAELESALFWISQAYNRLGRSTEDRRDTVNMMAKALSLLDRLILDFPGSEWADDAEILRIDIAFSLYRLGLRQYAGLIEKGLAIDDRSRIDIKLAALDAVLRIDQKRALDILSEIALNDPDPRVRKKIVLILGQSETEEAVVLLRKIAKNDPDVTVRRAAAIWIERN